MVDKKVSIRDGRAPLPVRSSTSRVMSANRGKDTKPEIILRKTLWAAGLKGYRLHRKKVPGRPDIAFTGKHVAVFVNGCFWHRCPTCKLPLPKSHQKFWREKFERNTKRDKAKVKQLRAQGWKVVTVWECEIKKDISRPLRAIKKVLIQ